MKPLKVEILTFSPATNWVWAPWKLFQSGLLKQKCIWIMLSLSFQYLITAGKNFKIIP